jgi:hypothetical protein
MKNILIAGGTGLIGKRLRQILQDQGYSVRLLTRNPTASGEYQWNPAAGALDPAALAGVDAVINLAGAGIADKRWTKARKKELVDSRVQSATLLARYFSELNVRPQVYVSASAIGYYGNSGDTVMQEDDMPADESFMVQCCRAWEAAADQVAALGIRTVKFRIGVVLDKEGGALPEIIKPLRFGLGTYFGDGRAWWPWIHRDDVCRAMVWALQNEAVSGVYNAVAPHPERCKMLVQSTAKAMRQPALFLPAPAFVLWLMLGEMSVVVLNSNRISAQKISNAGFEFEFPHLEPALKHIFTAP